MNPCRLLALMLPAAIAACGAGPDADASADALSATNATILLSRPDTAKLTASSANGFYFASLDENVIHRFVAGRPDQIVVRPANDRILSIAASGDGIAWAGLNGDVHFAAPDGNHDILLRSSSLSLGETADRGVIKAFLDMMKSLTRSVAEPAPRRLAMTGKHVYAVDETNTLRDETDGIPVPGFAISHLNADPSFEANRCEVEQLVVDDHAVYLLEACASFGRLERVALDGGGRTLLDSTPPRAGLGIDLLLDGGFLSYSAFDAPAEDATGAFPARFSLRRVPAAGGAVETVAVRDQPFLGLAIREGRYYYASLDSAGTGAIYAQPTGGGPAQVVSTLKATAGRTQLDTANDASFGIPGSLAWSGASLFAVVQESAANGLNAMQHVLLVQAP